MKDIEHIEIKEIKNIFGVRVVMANVKYLPEISQESLSYVFPRKVFSKSEGTEWVEAKSYKAVGRDMQLFLDEYCSHVGVTVPRS